MSLAYRRRSVPLVWACHRGGEQPAPYPALIPQLLQEVAALLPPGAAVVLLADRGLCWPVLVDGDSIVWTRQFGVASKFAAGPRTRVVLRVQEIRTA